MIVSLDRINRRINGIEAVYVLDFLKMLWAGELFERVVDAQTC